MRGHDDGVLLRGDSEDQAHRIGLATDAERVDFQLRLGDGKRAYEKLLERYPDEDGIRDKLVTGVQTCALPISQPWSWAMVQSACAV